MSLEASCQSPRFASWRIEDVFCEAGGCHDVEQLSERLSGLEARRAELAVDDGEAPEPLGGEGLRALQAHVRDMIETGDPPARKALLQALVDEIRVVSREDIHPTFNFLPGSASGALVSAPIGCER